MIRTQINLEEEQHRLLVLAAQKEGKSLSELVRITIDKQFINKLKKNKPSLAEALLKSAVNFRKINPGAPDDMSVNHNAYLYGRKSKKWSRVWKKIKQKK